MNRPLVLSLCATTRLLAACGDSDSESVDTTVATEAPAGTDPPVTDPPAGAGWAPIDHEGDCVCADGSPVEFLERPGDPTKVGLFFQGGGACFSAETCDFAEGTYVSSQNVSAESLDDRGGIFDAANAENPLADHSFAQAFFGGLAGVPADELVTLIDQSEADIEAAGVPLATYVAPGADHTIVGEDEFYEMEVGGVRLVDWLAALVAGEAPDDVHCETCN